jgi:two-component system LytT family response regulator
MIKAIAVDDELSGRRNLESLIGEYCPHINLLGSFSHPGEAREFLDTHEVNTLFLDIMMPGEDGFEFLASMKQHYHVIFVTAYDHFAIRAIRASAIDYLLKPLRVSDLIETEKRLLEIRTAEHRKAADMIAPLKVFFENYAAPQQVRKITLHHHKGFNVVDVERIIRLQADGNYTTFHINGADSILCSKPIREFEQILDTPSFIRIHKSHIINLRYMEQYTHEDVGYVILSGGHKVEVSRRRFHLLAGRLAAYSKETRQA